MNTAEHGFSPDSESKKNILDQVDLDMSQEQVAELFTPYITPQERNILGEEAEGLMVNVLSAASVFAWGGNFDSSAFAAVCDDQLASHLATTRDENGKEVEGLDYQEVYDENINPDRIDAMLKIATRTGIIRILESGRLQFDPNFVEKMDVFF
jgi:hypothetical protein